MAKTKEAIIPEANPIHNAFRKVTSLLFNCLYFLIERKEGRYNITKTTIMKYRFPLVGIPKM
jgi:hypothetical protein